MKLITRLTIVLAILLFLPASVEANDFFVEIDSIYPRIQQGESAQFNVTITNYAETSKTFTNSLSPADATGWIITPNSVSVPPDESRSFLLSLRPRSTVSTGTHLLSYRVRDSRDNSLEFNLAVSLLGEGDIIGYLPNVQTSIDVNTRQDPRDELVVEVEMRNRNRRDLTGLNLTIASEMFHQEIPLRIPPLETVTREFRFEIDDMQRPGVYEIRAELFYNLTNSIISSTNTPVEIIRYSNIEPIFESETSWFKTKKQITLKNKGNYERVQEIAIRAPLHQRIFMSTPEEYEIVEIEGRSNIQFSPSIAPGEEITLVLYRDYRPLVILIIIAVTGTIIYFLIRSPIIIRKQVYLLNKDSEGVTEFKVRLYVRNRSSSTVNGVKVIDYLSRITEYEDKHGKNMVKPDKVVKTTRKGTVLHWNLDSLESTEERILTYKLKSTLRIIGNLTLPRAKVSYLNSKGKDSSTTSFEPTFKQ